MTKLVMVALTFSTWIPDQASAEDFVLSMYATGQERVSEARVEVLVRVNSITVPGFLEGDCPSDDCGDTTTFYLGADETNTLVNTSDKGCGHHRLTCYNSGGSSISCSSSAVRRYKINAHKRCTTSCCSGHYKVTVSVHLTRTPVPTQSFVTWDSRDQGAAGAPTLSSSLTPADVPRAPVGEPAPPLPLAHVTDYHALGGIEGTSLPRSTSYFERVTDGNEVIDRTVTTTRTVSHSEYFASSDNIKVLVGTFEEPGADGPVDFPDNGPHAWATLAELGINLPPVVSFSIAPERSIAPGEIKVFRNGDQICFTAHPFSFHVPRQDLGLTWQSQAFPGVPAAASTDPTSFCTSDLDQGEGGVSVTVSEIDPATGNPLNESTARQLMRISGVPTLLLHDWWSGPVKLAELATALEDADGPDPTPPVPTFRVDMSAAHVNTFDIPMDFPWPPQGGAGGADPREALFDLTPDGRVAKGSKLKAPVQGIFAVDATLGRLEIRFPASGPGFDLFLLLDVLLDLIVPNRVELPEIRIPISVWKNEQGGSAADLVLTVALHDFDVIQVVGSGRGPSLWFDVSGNARIDLKVGAIMEGVQVGEIPIIPTPFLDLGEVEELLQLTLKFNLTNKFELGDMQGIQGATSIVMRLKFPFVSASGPVTGYVPELQARIQEAKKTTGLDRVNLVGHGMGGLVARYHAQYVDTDVSKLVLVATPNHGADFFFAVPFGVSWALDKFFTWALGPVVGPTVAAFLGGVIDFAFGQAARDMTPHSDLLGVLNRHRGDTADPLEVFPANVEHVYTVSGSGIEGTLPEAALTVLLGGTLTHFHIPTPVPLPPLYPLPNTPDFIVPGAVVLCLIPGTDCSPHGDALVPEDSVIVNNGDVVVNNDRVGAGHWSIRENPAAMDIIEHRLADDPPAGASIARSFPGLAAQVIRTASTSVAPGASDAITFKVDAGTELMQAMVLTSGSPATLSVIGPTGVAEEISFQLSEEGVSSGFHRVDWPLAGTWRVVAEVPSSATLPAELSVRALATTRTFVAVASGRSRYNLGDDAVISTVTMDGTAPGDAVETGALVVLPSGEQRYVPCHDDGAHGDGAAGDGLAVGVLADLQQSGTYRVIAWARRQFDDAGLPTVVDRRAYATFEVREDINLRVDSIVLADTAPPSGAAVQVDATITNDSTSALSGIPIVFAADGRGFDVAVVDLPAGASQVASATWQAEFGATSVSAAICTSTGVLETRQLAPPTATDEPGIEVALNDNSASATVVVAPPSPAIVQIAPLKVHPGQKFALDGSGFISDVAIVAYDWFVGADPIGGTPSYSGKHVLTDLPLGSPTGTETVSLVITDVLGRTSTGSSTREVLAAGDQILSGDIQAPVANAGSDLVVLAGDRVVLDGSGSTDDFGIAWAFWDLDIAEPEPSADVVGLVAEIPNGFGVAGRRDARIYVNDMRGNGPVWDEVAITVLKRPVTVSIHPPAVGEAGERVRLTVAVRDQAGDRLVDQGYVTLDIGPRSWRQHIGSCGVATFDVVLDVDPGTYDVAAHYDGGLMFADATLEFANFVVDDTMGPQIFVNNLEDGVMTHGQDFGVYASIADVGSPIETTEILLDGSPVDNGQTVPPLPPGEHVLTVTATDGNGNTTVIQTDVVVRPHVPPDLGRLFDGGLCAFGNVLVMNNAAISGPGAEDGLIAAGDLDVRNNATIAGSALAGCDASIANNATVTGNLAASGAITIGANAYVGGDIIGLPCDLCMVAALEAHCRSLDVDDLRRLAEASLAETRAELTPVLPTGALDQDSRLTLENNAAASIPPGIFAVRSFHLENNASLNVTSGRAVILVLEDLGVNNNVRIATDGGELAVVGLATSTIAIGNNATVQMALYAPLAKLTMLENNTFFEGGLAVRDLRIANNNQLVLQPSPVSRAPEGWCE